ncbi:hypothetical protein [Endozoicomonas sp.]|uniref:hypothetical protein n=1 Tax=Endozoicomonas sp. TaxID=1892382 RepID=UPI00383A46C2
MSFNERLHVAKQTYRNYLQDHPNDRLKALIKAVGSFYTRQVTALDSCNKLQQPKGGESLSSQSDKALIKRNASSHSIDPGLPDADASLANCVNKREEVQKDEAPSPKLDESIGEKAESHPAMADTPEIFPIPRTSLLDNSHSKHKRELAKADPKRRPPRQVNPFKTQRPPNNS